MTEYIKILNKLYDEGVAYKDVIRYVENENIKKCDNLMLKKAFILLQSYSNNYCLKHNLEKYNVCSIEFFDFNKKELNYTFKITCNKNNKEYNIHANLRTDFISVGISNNDANFSHLFSINNYNQIKKQLDEFLSGDFEVLSLLQKYE